MLCENSIIANQIGMNFGRIVLQVNVHRLMESEFCCGVILSRRSPVACCCICSSIRRLPDSLLSTCDVIGSLYALQFLIRGAFVLVLNFLMIQRNIKNRTENGLLIL